MMQLLLACCEAEEECRIVVAACLGHLALVAPSMVLPALQAQVSVADLLCLTQLGCGTELKLNNTVIAACLALVAPSVACLPSTLSRNLVRA